MIVTFEEHTSDLSEKELSMIEDIKSAFKSILKPGLTVKSPALCDALDNELYHWADIKDYRFNGVRLRKWVHHFREWHILPVMATSKGYFITNDVTLLGKQVDSLKQRGNSDYAAANGIQWFIDHPEDLN